jgi:hypothetical protein
MFHVEHFTIEKSGSCEKNCSTWSTIEKLRNSIKKYTKLLTIKNVPRGTFSYYFNKNKNNNKMFHVEHFIILRTLK